MQVLRVRTQAACPCLQRARGPRGQPSVTSGSTGRTWGAPGTVRFYGDTSVPLLQRPLSHTGTTQGIGGPGSTPLFLPSASAPALRHGRSFRSQQQLRLQPSPGAVRSPPVRQRVLLSPEHLLGPGHGPPGSKGDHGGPDGPEEDIHSAFQSLLTEMNKPGKKFSLKIANRLFGDKTCDFLSTFKESCLQFYHAELEQLSFVKDPEKSRKHINTWVSKKTEEKIKELLPSNSIDEQTRLVLVNAIYFKGSWNKPFDKKFTREMPFKINQQEQRPVQMMYQKDEFKMAYVEEVQMKILELPYVGEQLSMLILLPDDGVDLGTVEKNLTFEKFAAWTKPEAMKRTKVEVFLPRFKLQEDYAMSSVLQRLGMVDVFQQGKADLSAMSVERGLCLSTFVHQSVVEVNEEGTTAVAASALLVQGDCVEVRRIFCADHPFLFFIRDNTTSSLLFCGRLSSP